MSQSGPESYLGLFLDLVKLWTVASPSSKGFTEVHSFKIYVFGTSEAQSIMKEH